MFPSLLASQNHGEADLQDVELKPEEEEIINQLYPATKGQETLSSAYRLQLARKSSGIGRRPAIRRSSRDKPGERPANEKPLVAEVPIRPFVSCQRQSSFRQDPTFDCWRTTQPGMLAVS